jgi:secreted PhoX family phosphatase
MQSSKFRLLPLTFATLVALGVASCSDNNDDTTSTTKTFASIDFTETPVPSSNTDLVRNYTSSKATVTYSDGSKAEFPLSYNTLFTTTDRVGKNANEAGRLYDVNMNPLVDLNGDPVVAETPDSNSLLNVDGNLYLVTHYEYDNILADGSYVEKMSNWYSRMPMSMTLTNISQATDGKLTATDQKPIDFSSVNGIWIPCNGSQTPWNTHLGSEEDYDLFFVKPTNGVYDTATANGLKALTEKYFNSAKQANPYHYGYITEVTVKKDGSYAVKKHYNIGHGTWEMALVMPDQRTLYFGDDGTNTFMAMFIADKAADLSSGSLYAAKWNQTSSDNGGAANLTWIKLGNGNYAEAKSIIDSGITFWDIFDITTPEITADWAAQGYKAIRAGQATTEYVRLKAGKEQAAMYLETRRYAAYLGATTEFNKMEGVAVDRKDKKLYIAMSYIDKGMKADSTAPVDHIQVPKLNAGGVYEMTLVSGQKDQDGATINSDWIATTMSIPTALRGEDMATDAQGNTANLNKIANPDNIFFAEKMRTLFIGEDSGLHVNNMLWAYNVDTKKLTRLMTLATGAESTGLQVVENMNGQAYIMSNTQHQGDWLSTMPKDLSTALETEAKNQFGVNSKNVPNYYFQGRVGYIGGIPGL